MWNFSDIHLTCGNRCKTVVTIEQPMVIDVKCGDCHLTGGDRCETVVIIKQTILIDVKLCG